MVVKDVLLLNADHTPIQVLSWERAIVLVLEDKVQRVVDYVDLAIRTPSRSWTWPAVVSLPRYVAVASHGLPLTRSGVLARDRFSCQYCGYRPVLSSGRPDTGLLTLDHVVPRSRALGGRVTTEQGAIVPVESWENLVTACCTCNRRKAARTPREAQMPLSTVPRRPRHLEAVRILFARVEVQEEWRPFLPEGTGAKAA